MSDTSTASAQAEQNRNHGGRGAGLLALFVLLGLLTAAAIWLWPSGNANGANDASAVQAGAQNPGTVSGKGLPASADTSADQGTPASLHVDDPSGLVTWKNANDLLDAAGQAGVNYRSSLDKLSKLYPSLAGIDAAEVRRWADLKTCGNTPTEVDARVIIDYGGQIGETAARERAKNLIGDDAMAKNTDGSYKIPYVVGPESFLNTRGISNGWLEPFIYQPAPERAVRITLARPIVENGCVTHLDWTIGTFVDCLNWHWPLAPKNNVVVETTTPTSAPTTTTPTSAPTTTTPTSTTTTTTPTSTQHDECANVPGNQPVGYACSKTGQTGAIGNGAADPSGGKVDPVNNPVTTVETTRPVVTDRQSPAATQTTAAAAATTATFKVVTKAPATTVAPTAQPTASGVAPSIAPSTACNPTFMTCT